VEVNLGHSKRTADVVELPSKEIELKKGVICLWWRGACDINIQAVFMIMYSSGAMVSLVRSSVPPTTNQPVYTSYLRCLLVFDIASLQRYVICMHASLSLTTGHAAEWLPPLICHPWGLNCHVKADTSSLIRSECTMLPRISKPHLVVAGTQYSHDEQFDG
jgi:hypothetical protein